MPLINFAAREINYKIVYYGCGLCGKTTNLQYIHRKINPDARGKLVSIATEEERTLYFDFLPLTLGTVKGMQTRFHLYTVPGPELLQRQPQARAAGRRRRHLRRRLADHAPRRERRELPQPLGQPARPGRRPQQARASSSR